MKRHFYTVKVVVWRVKVGYPSHTSYGVVAYSATEALELVEALLDNATDIEKHRVDAVNAQGVVDIVGGEDG